MAFYIWQQSAPHTSTDTHVWLSSEQIAQRSHTTQVLVQSAKSFVLDLQDFLIFFICLCTKMIFAYNDGEISVREFLVIDPSIYFSSIFPV